MSVTVKEAQAYALHISEDGKSNDGEINFA